MSIFPEALPLAPSKLGTAEIRIDTSSSSDRLCGALHGQPLCKDRYWRLLVNGSIMMSNAEYEERTCAEAVFNATGDVLIAGLGLGMVLPPILAKPEVKSVTVVEINPDVIALVADAYKHPKLTVVQGDIFTWTPAKGQQFDFIWFDIWADICGDNLPEMARLSRRFARRLKGPRKMAHWCKRQCKAGRA